MSAEKSVGVNVSYVLVLIHFYDIIFSFVGFWPWSPPTFRATRGHHRDQLDHSNLCASLVSVSLWFSVLSLSDCRHLRRKLLVLWSDWAAHHPSLQGQSMVVARQFGSGRTQNFLVFVQVDSISLLRFGWSYSELVPNQTDVENSESRKSSLAVVITGLWSLLLRQCPTTFSTVSRFHGKQFRGRVWDVHVVDAIVRFPIANWRK